MSAVLSQMLRDAHIPALPSSVAVLRAGNVGGRRYQPTRPRREAVGGQQRPCVCGLMEQLRELCLKVSEQCREHHLLLTTATAVKKVLTKKNKIINSQFILGAGPNAENISRHTPPG